MVLHIISYKIITNVGIYTTVLECTAAKATGGLIVFYWYQIFALDSAVVEAQKM